jgi:hypothetical protein
MKRSCIALALATACGAGDDEVSGTTRADDQPPVTGACAIDSGHDDAFADCVEAFAPGEPASFGHDEMPDIVLGPPVAGPGASGSTDVASLGCGGSITLAFDPPGVVDGDGDDFVVFENAFAVGDESFAEPARVLVSHDGVAWHERECVPSGAGVWPPQGCAGVDPDGDAFDLASYGLPHARFVRLVDVTREHYGDDQWCENAGGGFDLDAALAIGADG